MLGLENLQNMGLLDRSIRFMLVAMMLAFYFMVQVNQFGAVLLIGTLVGIFFTTGLLGICPIYLISGVSSKKTYKTI